MAPTAVFCEVLRSLGYMLRCMRHIITAHRKKPPRPASNNRRGREGGGIRKVWGRVDVFSPEKAPKGGGTCSASTADPQLNCVFLFVKRASNTSQLWRAAHVYHRPLLLLLLLCLILLGFASLGRLLLPLSFSLSRFVLHCIDCRLSFLLPHTYTNRHHPPQNTTSPPARRQQLPRASTRRPRVWLPLLPSTPMNA